jgi:hypothetical protein
MTESMVMERTSNLILPEGFVSMDREEMMYVEGGIDIGDRILNFAIGVGALIGCIASLVGLKSSLGWWTRISYSALLKTGEFAAKCAGFGGGFAAIAVVVATVATAVGIIVSAIGYATIISSINATFATALTHFQIAFS